MFFLWINVTDIGAVLGGETGHQGVGAAAVRQRRFDIRLQAGAAAGIVTADEQDLGG